MEEMEKRSRRRTRDLVALAASQGLSQNEIGCARISMMARSTNGSVQGPDTEAQDQSSPDHQIQLATHGRSIQKCHVGLMHRSNCVLFDQLVGAGEKRIRHGQA